jgi:hypothetical protein
LAAAFLPALFRLGEPTLEQLDPAGEEELLELLAELLLDAAREQAARVTSPSAGPALIDDVEAEA